MAAGRPTDYRPEYCDMLIKHMSEGLSFESFAGLIGVCKQSLYSWAKAHPEFMDAKNIGSEKSRLMWEKLGLGMAVGKIKGGNPTVWIFAMKNRFGWRDRFEHAVADDSDPELASKSDDELDDML